jgi:hypothetical protein
MKKDIIIVLSLVIFEIAMYEVFREHLSDMFENNRKYHDELLYKVDQRHNPTVEDAVEVE